MKRLVRFGCLLMLGLSMSAGNACAELEVGDRAPDFELKGSDGKTHKLSDFKGKQAVVIAWFPKAFTGGWTAECDALRVGAIDNDFEVTLLGDRKFTVKKRDQGSGLDKFDVAVFTASCDTAETNKRYAEALKLDYPILADPERKAAQAYGVVNDSRPVPFRWTHIIGKDGKILFIDKEVKAASHAAAISAKLEELGVSKK